MIETGGPSTSEFSGMLSQVAGCAHPTGGSHGLTIEGPAQRGEGAKRRPRQVQQVPSAAKSIIRAGVLRDLGPVGWLRPHRVVSIHLNQSSLLEGRSTNNSAGTPLISRNAAATKGGPPVLGSWPPLGIVPGITPSLVSVGAPLASLPPPVLPPPGAAPVFSPVVVPVVS
jgi:hypothetical protein